jgi:hypothetical protein
MGAAMLRNVDMTSSSPVPNAPLRLLMSWMTPRTTPSEPSIGMHRMLRVR